MPANRPRFWILIGTLLLLGACTPRGPLQEVPADATGGHLVTVYEASNRSYGPFDPPVRGRLTDSRYSRVSIRIPPDHVAGDVQIPTGAADPDRHFLVAGQTRLADRAALVRDLRNYLNDLPINEREVIVFTPGYNMSGAESLVRTAQLTYDLDLPGVSALFSWPSAANVFGYAYDRESTLFSRDAYEAYLRAIVDARPRRMILVGHSMGSLLTMETLRQIAIADPGWIQRHVGGVILISPDIDIDVFRSQVRRIGELPQPFAIFVSERDRALALSARVTGEERRLGTVTDPAELADLEVTLLDISQFATGLGHFDFGRSPALLSLLGQMAAIELSFDRDPAARAGLFANTLLTVQNATRIILTP